MDIRIIKEKITQQELKRLAEESFGDMVKAVVDVERRVTAVGGSMHADAEAQLLSGGSRQENLWGINIYPDLSTDERLQFESLINIRPRQNNRSMEIQDETLRKNIAEIVNSLIE